MFDSNNPPGFPLPPLPPPPLPFSQQSAFFPSLPTNSANPSNFIPRPFLPPPPLPTTFPLPPNPPEFLSKMLQIPPPPLPVPAPVNTSSSTTTNNTNSTIDNTDLYDPLKAEEEEEENTEEKKPITPKPTSRTFNIKKEYTIKIEPSKSYQLSYFS